MFPLFRVSAEKTLRNLVHLTAPGILLTSASTEKEKKEKKKPHRVLLLSRHQQLHFDAEGRWRRAIRSYATRGPAAKSFKVTAGEEEVPHGCRCRVTEKKQNTCSCFRESVAGTFITHRGRVLENFRSSSPEKKKGAANVPREVSCRNSSLHCASVEDFFFFFIFVLQVVGCVLK